MSHLTPEPPQPALTLTDFLLARLAEDEAIARAAVLGEPDEKGGDRWWAVKDRRLDDEGAPIALVKGENPLDRPGEDPTYALAAAHVCYGDEPRALVHIARHNPARVLADVEAKRRIVEKCSEILAVDGWEYSDAPDLAEDALYALAQPYADHPNFPPEWRNT